MRLVAIGVETQIRTKPHCGKLEPRKVRLAAALTRRLGQAQINLRKARTSCDNGLRR
jgi:hypothetical protein